MKSFTSFFGKKKDSKFEEFKKKYYSEEEKEKRAKEITKLITKTTVEMVEDENKIKKLEKRLKALNESKTKGGKHAKRTRRKGGKHAKRTRRKGGKHAKRTRRTK